MSTFPTSSRPGAARLRGAQRLARSGLAAIAFTLLGACTALGAGGAPDSPADPSLIAELPPSIASFELDGYRWFEDDSGGYTFRYRNAKKKRLADVYVYPVAHENAALGHKALVMGSTRATLQAINEAAAQGLYANFNVLATATRARGVRTVARVQATYLRENLASYTMLYQSEHDGTLMKIRLSMPDNDSNRANGEWDAFAERVFELVVDDLERQAGADRSRVTARTALVPARRIAGDEPNAVDERAPHHASRIRLPAAVDAGLPNG